MTTLKEAIAKRDEFLKENPELKNFQEGIDNLFRNKNYHERMIALGNLTHMCTRQLSFTNRSIAMDLEELESHVKNLTETIQNSVQTKQD